MDNKAFGHRAGTLEHEIEVFLKQFGLKKTLKSFQKRVLLPPTPSSRSFISAFLEAAGPYSFLQWEVVDKEPKLRALIPCDNASLYGTPQYDEMLQKRGRGKEEGEQQDKKSKKKSKKKKKKKKSKKEKKSAGSLSRMYLTRSRAGNEEGKMHVMSDESVLKRSRLGKSDVENENDFKS